MNIGWIGLGAIGTQMVKRLLSAGFAVTSYAKGKGLDEVIGLGARSEADYRTLARSSDLLIICVFDDTQIREVLFDQGTLAAMQSGCTLAIHTTGSPALMRAIAAAAPTDVDVLDATFSGGPQAVAAGRLTLMIGGDARGLDHARPAFEAYAAQLYHLGTVGSGQIIKLLNNLLFATNLMNATQAIKLGEEQGFEAATIARVISDCSGSSYAMTRFDSPASPATLMEMVGPYLGKDVSSAFSAAESVGLDMKAFAATAAYFSASKPNDANR